MRNENILIGNGILADCLAKVRRNFYERLDANRHAAVYVGTFDESYAEPEFTGKFLDLCAYYYETEGDERALQKGMTVVESIQHHQREDGYLGCLEKGKELVAFSFWNHGFTLYGLTRMYEATQDMRIFMLVRRAADYVLSVYQNPSNPDILHASHNGSQNISCLYAMGRAYLVTKDMRYLQFIERVLIHCEKGQMNLLSFKNIFELSSKKGIEMLVVFLGVLQYGQITENETVIAAARRYWDGIWKTQIRNTGNGTVGEQWIENGNAARLIPTEEKPNETCVAVGWAELSLSLFHTEKKPRYLDAIEKTLFNHMIGSLDKNGEDLAYYQGNYGKKIFRTDDGAYQCCRYRGFTLFTYLKSYLYSYENDCFIPLIYCPSAFHAPDLSIIQDTVYPANGLLSFTVKNEQRPQTMKLRIPIWCHEWHLTGATGEQTADGFLTIALPVGSYQICLDITMSVVKEEHTINGKQYLSYTYGPLLLAADTHYGGPLWCPADADAPVIPIETNGSSLVHFITDGIHLVDFASAGSNAPSNDQYTVFIPKK